jgi:hypothetical protein
LLRQHHAMVRSYNYAISVAAVWAAWGAIAQADPAAPPIAPVAPAAAAGTARSDAGTDAGRDAGPAAVAPAAPAAPASGASGEPSDAALVHQAGAEAIEVFDERPDKPFDRDTELRLTGAELAARGAVDLATALALVPDVTVRDAGRGGFNVDIRGARKGAVSILIDGVLVTDPYYGTFDVSTIPITDILQIRVATTPQSPIDGPGGPGGVIEVHTRDAIGPQLVIARLTADSLPSLGATGTARAQLARRLSLRLSGSALAGARDLALPSAAAVGEDRHALTGAGRLEYRDGARRVAVDGFVDDRHYVSPPSDTVLRSLILVIDRETTARAQVRADDAFGPVQVQAEAWTHYLSRQSRMFADPALSAQIQVENLQALRSGVRALATQAVLRDFRWAASTTVDFEKAVVSNAANQVVRGHTTLVEPAADLQYEHRRFRADLAGGLALPFGVNARPWPEAKAVARYRPVDDLELTATGAYKGRLPSLRERFDAATGNPNLDPERIAHAELRAVEHIDEHLHLELAPYLKRSTGAIRGSQLAVNFGQLINLGTVNFWGVDSRARITPHRRIELGASYEYIRARASKTADLPAQDDPLDRLPHHRWDAWVEGRPGAWLSGLARVTYYGAAIDQGLRVDGYALVSANLAAKITANYLAVARVDDLLNARPETRAGYHTAGRVVSLVMQGTWE